MLFGFSGVVYFIETINSITKELLIHTLELYIKRILSYLFTYQKYRYFEIGNMVNTIDEGVFLSMKKLMHVHVGLSKSLT